jgi:hypothetical protein
MTYMRLALFQMFVRSVICAGFWTVACSGSLLACGCKSPEISVALQRADVVFIGKVVNIRDFGQDTYSAPARRVMVTFQVSRWWKGPVRRITVMHTRINTSDCDGFLSLKRGEEYIVYGYRKKNWNFRDALPNADEVLGTGLCTRTTKLKFAVEDLKELGTDKAPE